MVNRSMNMFEFIFAIFFILKIAEIGIVSQWNWFLVFLPMVFNFVFKLFSWVIRTLGLRRSADVAIQDIYIDHIRNKAIKKVRNEIPKKL